MTPDEIAGLLQTLIKDKVVVHVEFALQPAQYGTCRVESWHTAHVPEGTNDDERINRQIDLQQAAMIAAQNEVNEALIRYTEQQIALAEKMKELELARKAAAKAQQEAAMAERAAMKEVAALNKDKAAGIAPSEEEIPF